MGVVDYRDKTKRYNDGSSLVGLGMTQAQHEAATGDNTATGGWIVISYLDGGDLNRDVQAAKDYDEGGEFLGETVDTDDFVMNNVAKQTDAITLKILKYWEENPLPTRYFLPRGSEWQVHYHPSMKKDRAFNLPTGRGQRTTSFTARGDNDDHVFEDVAAIDGAGQAAWPATLDDAKDAVFPGA